jgi:hypothetical protein
MTIISHNLLGSYITYIDNVTYSHNKKKLKLLFLGLNNKKWKNSSKFNGEHPFIFLFKNSTKIYFFKLI